MTFWGAMATALASISRLYIVLTSVDWTGATDTLQDVYTGLDVSGNFDTVYTNDSNLSTMYTFDKLKAQIMANWPAD